MAKLPSAVNEFIEGINFSTFAIALVAATAALWLNSKYVSQDLYKKDQEILILRVTSLENEAKTLRFLVTQNQDRITELTAVLTKIDALISRLITDDGEIIISKEMKRLEIDIAEIKKDINYIKSCVNK